MADPYDVLALQNTAEVLRAEFEAIHNHSQWIQLSCVEVEEIKGSLPAGDQEIKLDEVEALAAYCKNVHNLPGAGQSAICLSGGGIRSAAFGLGILQGLARRNILSATHYISSVSGGGYIASWLVSWAHREAVKRNKADFTAIETAIANRPAYAPFEQAPFRWLRANQKFLTPRGGIGSPDTWAAVASFVRDLMLNWVVFIPMIVGILLLPHVLELLLQW